MKKQIIGLALAVTVLMVGCGSNTTKNTGVTTIETVANETDSTDKELVQAVNELLPDHIQEGVEVKTVAMRENKELYIEIDVTHANDNSNIKFPLEDIAEVSVSNITDPILDLDDTYYNMWDTITLDFGAYGHVTFSKSDVTDNGYGKYFSIDGGVLQK